MTKCIVLGEQPTEVKKKPIEFVKCLNVDLVYNKPSSLPNSFKNLELICKNYSGSVYDMIFAYQEDRGIGVLYFGYWNDGVSE